MILYFSGTGNSKYVAKSIAHNLNDEIVSLNDVIKNNLPAKFHSEKPFVIVAPIYAWRLPRIIENLFEKADFTGSNEIYFVATMGSQTGNCYKYCKMLCENKNLTFKGFQGIKMPNNYIAKNDIEHDKEVNTALSNAEPLLVEISEKIKHDDIIEKDDKTPVPWFLSSAVNSAFNKFVISSKNFVVSDKCTSCGKCARLCVTNNISMINGKPTFKNNCINCFACLSHCPQSAINIKGKPEVPKRFVCPEYDEHIS